jgi:hypothetical protein
MAFPKTQKRKSRPQTSSPDEGSVANYTGDAYERPSKRPKDSAGPKSEKSELPSSSSINAGSSSTIPSQLDFEGNRYWEISKTRRVTISEFRGKKMVDVREYYEKDGKTLPGKKVWRNLYTHLKCHERFVDLRIRLCIGNQHDRRAILGSSADITCH